MQVPEYLIRPRFPVFQGRSHFTLFTDKRTNAIVVSKKLDQGHREIDVTNILQGGPCLVPKLDQYALFGTPYIVMPYYKNGDLVDEAGRRIRFNKRFTEDQAIHIVAQIIIALEHMHQKGVIHKDVKCDNIFLESSFDYDTPGKDMHVVLGDFDSAYYKHEDPDVDKYLKSAGTPSHLPPESMSYKDRIWDSPKIDVWALGIVFYSLLHLKFPFAFHPACTEIKLMHQVLTTEKIFMADHVSSGVRDVIFKMLDINHDTRVDISWLCECDIFRDAVRFHKYRVQK